MISTISSVCSLLIGMGILLAGSGLLGTLLGLRASVEMFSELTIGLVMSAYFMGYIVGSYFCPELIRRVGHIRTFTALAAMAAVVSLLHGMWVNPWFWGVLRLINGICILGLYMVIESWLNDQVHHRRGELFAVYMMVSLAALGVGQFLMVIYGPEGMESFAIVALLFCLGLIPLALTRVHQPTLVTSVNVPVKELLEISPVGSIGSFASGLITGAFWGLSAVYAVNIGLTNSGVAAFIAAAIFGGAVLQWPIGRLSDRFDRRQVLMWVALGSAVVAALIFMIGSDSLPLLILLTVPYGGLSFSLYALSVAHTHDRMHGGDAMGVTRGLLLLNGIGATIGPLLLGVGMSLTEAVTFPLILALLLVGLAIFTWRRIALDPAVPTEERGEFVLLTRTSPTVIEMDPRTDVELELDLEQKGL
jgi:MFS family permease